MNLPILQNECEFLVKCFINLYEELEQYTKVYKAAHMSQASQLCGTYALYKEYGDYEEVSLEHIKNALDELQPDEYISYFINRKREIDDYKRSFKGEYKMLSKEESTHVSHLITRVDALHTKYWAYSTTLNDIILKCLYEGVQEVQG
jgi:hypothetical protein